MSALTWQRNEGFTSSAPTCGCCGSGKVQWWPLMAGWLLPEEGLVGRFGCCDSCRVEWDGIWARKGAGE